MFQKAFQIQTIKHNNNNSVCIMERTNELSIIIFLWLIGFGFVSRSIISENGVHHHYIHEKNRLRSDFTRSFAGKRLRHHTDIDTAHPHTPSTQKVLVLPDISQDEEMNIQAEMKHIIIDGIKNSKKLDLTFDEMDPNAVWVIHSQHIECEEKVLPMVKERYARLQKPWKLFFLDFSDQGQEEDPRQCLADINIIFNSTEYVHFAARAVFGEEDRHIEFQASDNETTKFHNMGTPANWDEYLTIDVPQLDKNSKIKVTHGYVQPLRLGVRSDLSDHIVEQLELKTNSSTTELGSGSVPNIARSKAAIHLWSIKEIEEGKDHELRNRVSNALLDLALESNLTKHVITATEIGEPDQAGRRYVQSDYVQELLDYKIVVVAQRDLWEDHYRLFEALASGAMVMTDPMHPLPIGLSHGRDLIVYDSIWELKQYIRYYLEHDEERIRIAKSGYDVAMSKHRSWQIMERIILADWTKYNWGEFSEGYPINQVVR